MASIAFTKYTMAAFQSMAYDLAGMRPEKVAEAPRSGGLFGLLRK